MYMFVRSYVFVRVATRRNPNGLDMNPNSKNANVKHDKLWKQTCMPIKPMTRVGHDHTYGKCVTDCTGNLSCE